MQYEDDLDIGTTAALTLWVLLILIIIRYIQQ